jgi:hypothetical protein
MLQREVRVRINCRKGPQRSTVERLRRKYSLSRCPKGHGSANSAFFCPKQNRSLQPFFADLSVINRSGRFLQSNRCTAIMITVLHKIHSRLQQRHLACDCLQHAPLGAYPVEEPPALRHYDIKFINISETYVKIHASAYTAYFCGDPLYLYIHRKILKKTFGSFCRQETNLWTEFLYSV